MCGISGFWGEIAQTPDALTRLENMTTALSHRGPDGKGCWLGPNVGLGHTRLAVIDLAGGEQPMWDARKEKVIVFNGEIYNYRELKGELEAQGFAFRTRSDTEVIAAAIEAWGIEAGLLRLSGMFAFAIYDTRNRSLLLARDRVGIKPLYYSHTPGGLLFASEQKSLLASGWLSRDVNPVAIHDYLAKGYAVTPDTCWADIQMLEPGTWLEMGPAGSRRGRYWKWQSRVNDELGYQDAIEKTEQTLSDSLRSQLVSDVPIAAFLSGGLDSALNVALLSRGLMPGIQTFSMGFGDPAYDESHVARQVAEHFGTDHHEARMEGGKGDADLFCKIVGQYDEPFGDSSCIPTFLLCGEMRKHVKVAISGDGGDEVLGGYGRYFQARWLAALSNLQSMRPLLDPVFHRLERPLGAAGRRAAKAWRLACLPRKVMLSSLNTYFSEEERLALYRPEFAQLALSKGPTTDRYTQFVPDAPTDPINQIIAAEFRQRLHGDYLRKVDIASSAHGLEVRVPFLDNSMLDLASELPTRFKVGRYGQTKILSRRLAERLLPPGIANRPKQGFGLPLDRWAGPQLHEFLKGLLLDSQARIHHWMKPAAVERVWLAFDNGQAGGSLSRYQRYQRVFLLSALELWLRRWEPQLA
jgi:asparagine synthase (glutamine-hydrolysing)